MDFQKNHIAIFRFEASSDIGAGHAIRSIALADTFKSRGWKIFIVTSKESLHFLPLLKTYERISPEDFYQDPRKCHCLIIDNYKADKSYETHFRPFASKIVVIDDLANRPHDCDILIDQSFQRQTVAYAALVPKHCLILTGCKYALIRSHFTQMRQHSLNRRHRKNKPISRILISLGGSPTLDTLYQVLHVIKMSRFNKVVDLVLGFSSKHLLTIKKLAHDLPYELNLHIDPNLPALMAEADLAISAPGSSTWERCCLGLPFISILTADNQKNILEQLLATKRTMLLSDLPQVLEMTTTLPSNDRLVDGFGTNRVYLALVTTPATICMRDVTEQDMKTIFNWQILPAIRQFANHSTPPTWEEHCTWFYKRLTHSENPYWIIEYQNKPCGVVSLEFDSHDSHYLLSWYLDPTYQNMGLGTAALEQTTQLVWPTPIKAQVKPINVASQKALQKANYKKISAEFYVSHEL